MRIKFLILVGLVLIGGCGGTRPTETIQDFSQYFDGHQGCFVLYDSNSNSYIRYNPQECKKRYPPCSTFKIANSLIALETKVASGPNFPLPWDGSKQPIPNWNSDHTMRTAFVNSVLWYYQEIARRIGPKRMAEFVKKFDYGNCDTTGDINTFWLENGTLKISADEQVELLRKLWADKLPVTKEAQRNTRELMIVSRQGGKTLYGKTGTGGDIKADVADLGWFVGCVTEGERKVFFATRITGQPDASGRKSREIAYEILKKLQI
jgi:beta-lactamase class D